MAKNEKPSSKDFDAQRDAQAKEAKKKLKEAEKAGTGAKKAKAEKTPKKKKFSRFWKDFRGELKKIVWPDFKTVLKNTGIVLLTTVIIGIPVWILDFALTKGVTGMKDLAQNAQTEAATTAPGQGLEDLLGTTAAGDEAETTANSATEPGEESDTEPTTESANEPTTAPAAEPTTVTAAEPTTEPAQ